MLELKFWVFEQRKSFYCNESVGGYVIFFIPSSSKEASSFWSRFWHRLWPRFWSPAKLFKKILLHWALNSSYSSLIVALVSQKIVSEEFGFGPFFEVELRLQQLWSLLLTSYDCNLLYYCDFGELWVLLWESYDCKVLLTALLAYLCVLLCW